MGSQRRTPPPPPPRPSKKKAGEGMWQAWWLLLLALCAVLVVILGLIWLFIEFPGLAGWKEVSKESAEGRARQEKWRRDSVILGELQRRGRRVTVDQLVTDLEEVLVVKSDPKKCAKMFVDQDEEVGNPGVDVQQQLWGEFGRLSSAVAEAGGGSPSKLLKRSSPSKFHKRSSYSKLLHKRSSPSKLLKRSWPSKLRTRWKRKGCKSLK